MDNGREIRRILKENGFQRMLCRDSWHRRSWTVRIWGNDIEVFDSPDKSRKYFLGNLDSMNINPILEEIDKIEDIK